MRLHQRLGFTKRGPAVITAMVVIGSLPGVLLAAPSSATTHAITSGYNAAVNSVVNPSNRKGGTITYGWSSGPDSTDPGNTYSASMWDFDHLYAMPLMTFKSCPGACAL